MIKTYSVPVRTTVSADYLIKATSKKEAYELVAADMKQSLDKLLKNAVPHPQIINVDGYTEAMKSSITIIASHE